MTDMPKEIWAYIDRKGTYWNDHDPENGDVKYIRADLVPDSEDMTIAFLLGLHSKQALQTEDPEPNDEK